MSVWIMNLKDNRKESTVNETEKKFAFCKEKGILGIGWVGYEENGIEDLGFKKAKNAIIRFKPKDLVWVKNTTKKEYYICEISENKDEYIRNNLRMGLPEKYIIAQVGHSSASITKDVYDHINSERQSKYGHFGNFCVKGNPNN